MRTVSLLSVLMLFCALVYGQTRPFKGRITDEKGNPIPFATITEVGTNNITTADANGTFTINVNPNARLEIKASGHQPQTLNASGNGINFTLGSAHDEEVVITALGIKREAKATGYAMAALPPSNIIQARPSNIANGFTGKVSGLQVNTVNNGISPATRILLRGERSITGNNQALIVLDNIPVPVDYLNSLNPDDVENISVLKGANAAALYGSDASNGAILITTKRGLNTSSGVTFNHSTTIEQLSFLPKFNTRFGAASIEGDSINTYTGFYGRIPYESMMYGPEYNSQLVKLGYVKQLTRPDGSLYDSTNQTTYNFKNPVKAFFQTGLTVQNGINYQANDQNSSFYLSAQAVNTSGTIPKDKSDRYSVRLGAARNYNKFSSSFSVGYTRTNTNVAGVDYNLGRTVYSNLLNTPGEVPITNFKNLNAPFANENDWYNAYYPNPYWQVENSRVKSTRDDILGSLDLNLKATSWLNFVYRVGITASNYQQKNTIGGVSFSDYEIYDPLGALNIASLNPNGVQPKMFDRTQSRFIIQSDFLVNMERKFIHNDLNARLVLGNSLNKDTRRTLQSGNANINLNNNSNLLNPLQIPGLYDVSGTLGSSANTEELIHVGKIGVYGSLQLGWKNYLFAELTARNDWVSVLDPSHRSVFSPGVNTSFVFTDAISFLKNISWLSFGKIFASYTRVGNVNVQPYSLSNTFGQVNGFPYGNLTGLSLNTQAANYNLRPEIVVSNEAGLQLGLFKNRAIVGITHYNENAKDQVIPVQISSSTGFMSTLANIGAVKNSGWEFDARITPLLNLGPVRVNMAGNLTFYSSKVSDMDPNNKSMMIGGYANGAGIYTIENQPMRVLQVIDWKRDSMGHVIVDAITGQPSASDKVTNVGQSTPKIILALNPSFEYKSFGLNIIGEYRGGYVVYNNIGSALAMSGASEVTTNTGRQKFVYPNSVIIVNGKSVPNTNIVVNNASNGAGFFATTYATAGTPFVTSGAFWKVREVIFTYNIPLKTNKFIKRAVVGLTARNLFTFLPKDNVYADPEYSVFGTGNAQGISNENVQPPTRIFGATINVGF